MLVGIDYLVSLTGFSYGHCRDRLAKSARFPKPVFRKPLKWVKDDVDSWLANISR